MCFSSVAAYTFTAIETSPNEITPFQIDLMAPSHALFEHLFYRAAYTSPERRISPWPTAVRAAVPRARG
jgi:hypothetical protein